MQNLIKNPCFSARFDASAASNRTPRLGGFNARSPADKKFSRKWDQVVCNFDSP
jgi:hypothetical protein